jgi:hypothetical protein
MPAEKRNHNKKATPGKINRPPNAWILYRSDRLKELKGRPEIAGMPQATLSQLISRESRSHPIYCQAYITILIDAWHSEPNNVRDYYCKAADRKKAEHMALHPGKIVNEPYLASAKRFHARQIINTIQGEMLRLNLQSGCLLRLQQLHQSTVAALSLTIEARDMSPLQITQMTKAKTSISRCQ